MIDNPFVTNGEFCENGPLKTEKWSANNKKFISRPKSSFGRGHFYFALFTSWPSSCGCFRQRVRCGVMSVQFGQALHRRQPGHRWHHTSFPQGVERP